MRLHEDKRLFRQAVTATSEMLSIPEIFIEKDYWVTYALHAIFHDSIGEQTVFKWQNYEILSGIVAPQTR
jgi:hypothetical protein